MLPAILSSCHSLLFRPICSHPFFLPSLFISFCVFSVSLSAILSSSPSYRITTCFSLYLSPTWMHVWPSTLIISLTSTLPALLDLLFFSDACLSLNVLYIDAVSDYSRSTCSSGSKYQTFYTISLGWNWDCRAMLAPWLLLCLFFFLFHNPELHSWVSKALLSVKIQHHL